VQIEDSFLNAKLHQHITASSEIVNTDLAEGIVHYFIISCTTRNNGYAIKQWLMICDVVLV